MGNAKTYTDGQRLDAKELRNILSTQVEGVYFGDFCTYTASMIEDRDFGVVQVVPRISHIEEGGYVVHINGNAQQVFSL